MPEKINLRIFDVVGSPVWVSTEDGQKVYEKIKAAFGAGRAVVLSFANRGNLITVFLNAAIGQLYNGDYSEKFLGENLSYAEISDDDRTMVGRAIGNAKRYFAHRPQFDAAWKEEVGNDEE